MRSKKLEEIKKYIEELKAIKIELSNQEKNKFIEGIPYEITFKDGRTITREKLSKNKKDGSAIIILPVLKSGEIIINIEPRVFTKETVSIGFPAGYIEENETPLEAAKRELLEETGYQASSYILLDSFYQDEGISSAYNHCFIALNCEKISNQKLDRDEIVKNTLVYFDELLELEKLGYINSSNSKLTLLRAKQYLS
ncbi:MAG: NUDIX hydrolase [Bacilli bacterium]|nr:NUDIX hydrolase [Bacilli bacterium]